MSLSAFLPDPDGASLTRGEEGSMLRWSFLGKTHAVRSGQVRRRKSPVRARNSGAAGSPAG
jgi:hypothetical protein